MCHSLARLHRSMVDPLALRDESARSGGATIIPMFSVEVAEPPPACPPGGSDL
jgi:hypothetical protein